MPSASVSRRPWYDRPLGLGSVAGIPLALSTSWFFIAAIMVALFAPQIRGVTGLSWLAAGAVAFAYALILAVSVLLHEVAHAVAARSVGWTGSRIEITLWGGHTSFDAPHPTPGASVLVSVVGPIVNLVLGGAGWLLMQTWEPQGVPSLLLYMAVFSNLAVGVFNLLPGLPLDGGRVVEAVAWKATGSQAKGTIAAGWAGRGLVILAVGVVLYRLITRQETLPISYVVLFVVVLVPLYTGASEAVNHGRLRLRLEAMSAAELLSPVAVLPASATVADALAAGVLGDTVVVALTGEGKHLLRVMPEAVERVPAEAADQTPVGAVGIRADDGAALPLTADGDALARAALESISGTVLVVDEAGTCVGAVRREDVVAAIEGRHGKEKTA